MLAVCAVMAMLAFLLPGSAGASDLLIDTARIELSQAGRSAAIRIRNRSGQARTIRIQAQAWSQIDGTDSYAPTGDLLVSPRTVVLAPGREQVVRAALSRQPDSDRELAYRIYFKEEASASGSGPTLPGNEFRIGVPVFVQATKGLAAPKLAWAVSRTAGGSLKVLLRNDGNAHVQVFDFALYAPGSDGPLAVEQVSSWILGGQSRTWVLEADSGESAATGRLRLKAYTDAGDIDAEIAP